MPRDLPVGNGNLLVNFDQDYNIRDIYYPYVGKANHADLGKSRTGVWVDAQPTSWLGDSGWVKQMEYEPETLATHVTATNDELRLKVVFQDVVDFHDNIFLRRVEVFNLDQRTRNIRLFFHYDFRFWEAGLGDAIHYHPNRKVLVAYKDNCYFLMNAAQDSRVGIQDWSTGNKNGEGKHESWREAEEGVLKKRPVSFGSVDGVIGVNQPHLSPGESSVFYTWLAAGQDLEEVLLLDSLVSRRTPQHFLDGTINYWRAWVNKERIDFHDIPPEVVDLYKRSLLILRTQVDNRGGILAANDSDIAELAHGKETYSYVWPRDGALTAKALDKAGYSYLSTRFYDFCKDVLYYEPQSLQDGDQRARSEKAYMLHKYTPDRMVAANWMSWEWEDEAGITHPPIEEDQTAIIPVVLWQHYLKFRDIEVVEPWFRPLIIHVGNFMVEYLDSHTNLPRPSFDLWEENRAVYSYTVATVWAGLIACANFAELFGQLDETNKFRKVASKIREACETHLYDEEEGRFLKGVRISLDGHVDKSDKKLHKVDASLFGLWYYGMFDPNDPRIDRTMKAIEERLRTPIGGLARYEGDRYHWDNALEGEDEKIPGNPWFITTIWLAQHRIAKAQTLEELRRALPILKWVCAKSLPSGVLAEQIHPKTGAPLSVSPLTWSHASLISAVREYIEKYEVLEEKIDSLP